MSTNTLDLRAELMRIEGLPRDKQGEAFTEFLASLHVERSAKSLRDHQTIQQEIAWARFDNYFEPMKLQSLNSETCLSVENAIVGLVFHDSYERLPAILNLGEWMGYADFLRLLGEEWSSFDNVSQHIDELWASPLTNADFPVREMMTPNEQAAYDALPDVVTIYRGCYAENKWGLSWSLDKAVAERFPSLLRYRQPGQAILVTAKVEKKNIIAVKLSREESEIITYMPKHVSTRHIKGIETVRAMVAGVAA